MTRYLINTFINLHIIDKLSLNYITNLAYYFKSGDTLIFIDYLNLNSMYMTSIKFYENYIKENCNISVSILFKEVLDTQLNYIDNTTTALLEKNKLEHTNTTDARSNYLYCLLNYNTAKSITNTNMYYKYQKFIYNFYLMIADNNYNFDIFIITDTCFLQWIIDIAMINIEFKNKINIYNSRTRILLLEDINYSYVSSYKVNNYNLLSIQKLASSINTISNNEKNKIDGIYITCRYDMYQKYKLNLSLFKTNKVVYNHDIKDITNNYIIDARYNYNMYYSIIKPILYFNKLLISDINRLINSKHEITINSILYLDEKLYLNTSINNTIKDYDNTIKDYINIEYIVDYLCQSVAINIFIIDLLFRNIYDSLLYNTKCNFILSDKIIYTIHLNFYYIIKNTLSYITDEYDKVLNYINSVKIKSHIVSKVKKLLDTYLKDTMTINSYYKIEYSITFDNIIALLDTIPSNDTISSNDTIPSNDTISSNDNKKTSNTILLCIDYCNNFDIKEYIRSCETYYSNITVNILEPIKKLDINLYKSINNIIVNYYNSRLDTNKTISLHYIYKLYCMSSNIIYDNINCISSNIIYDTINCIAHNNEDYITTVISSNNLVNSPDLLENNQYNTYNSTSLDVKDNTMLAITNDVLDILDRLNGYYDVDIGPYDLILSDVITEYYIEDYKKLTEFVRYNKDKLSSFDINDYKDIDLLRYKYNSVKSDSISSFNINLKCVSNNGFTNLRKWYNILPFIRDYNLEYCNKSTPIPYTNNIDTFYNCLINEKDFSCYFRYECYNLRSVYKLKWIQYCLEHKSTTPQLEAQNNKSYKAVFIEFRKLPHIETIIINTILELNKSMLGEWRHLIICGKDNADMVTRLSRFINYNIGYDLLTVKVLTIDIKTVKDYSRLLLTKDFWLLMYDNKEEYTKLKRVLIYQEDSIMFNGSRIKEYLKWSYIGAPWYKNNKHNPKNVGNGGFSLRDPKLMLSIVSNINTKSDYDIPEDVLFSSRVYAMNSNYLADWDTANGFSCELIPVDFNKELPVGGHKWWWGMSFKDSKRLLSLCVNNNDVNNICSNKFIIYNGKLLNSAEYYKNTSGYNINYYNYLKKYMASRSGNDVFYFDILMYNQIYNDDIIKSKLSLYDFYNNYGHERGDIINEYQFYKLYPADKYILLTNTTNTIYVKNNNKLMELNKFIMTNDNKELHYYLEYNNLIENTINTIHTNKFELLILLQIGNIDIGIEIINKIFKNYNTKYKLLISCIKGLTIQNLVILLKKYKLDYILFENINFGSDIQPFVQQLWYLYKNNYNVNYILKIHTKTDIKWRNEMIDIFLDGNLDYLINIMNNNIQIGMLGQYKYKIKIKNDIFCKKTINKLYDTKLKYVAITEHEFIGGTVFLSRYDNLLSLFKEYDNNNNYLMSLLKALFKSTFYYDNFLLFTNSVIHTFERYFGYLIYKNNKKIEGITNYINTKKLLIYACHFGNELRSINYKAISYYKNLELNYNFKLYIIYSYDNNYVKDITFLKYKLAELNILNLEVDNKGYDFWKYKLGIKYALENQYDKCILINDSFFYSRYINDIFDWINYNNHNHLLGIFDNYEVKEHYQSYFLVLDKILYNYYYKLINKLNDVHDIIKNYEIELSNKIINNTSFKTNCYYNVHYFNINNNIYFNNMNLFNKSNMLPFIKKKQLILFYVYDDIYQKYKNNELSYKALQDYYTNLIIEKEKFNWKYYLVRYIDLPKTFNKDDAYNHFIKHGKNEQRIYDKNLIPILNKNLKSKYAVLF